MLTPSLSTSTAVDANEITDRSPAPSRCADHCQATADPVETTAEQLNHARRRQWLTILFAIVLASTASLVSAEQPTPSIQYDAVTAAGHQPHPTAVIDPGRIAGGAMRVPPQVHSRPVYVELAARLANFDADAEPDGWRAELVLRDRLDRPTPMRCHASFELMPRVPTLTGTRFLDAAELPIRWSMPLQFDADGVATVKLPLRKSLRPLLGWSSAAYPSSGIRSHNAGVDRRGIRQFSRTRSFVTLDLRETIGTPNSGELRVRVSVPTQGVFESVTPVSIRPSVLVDTQWPYR